MASESFHGGLWNFLPFFERHSQIKAPQFDIQGLMFCCNFEILQTLLNYSGSMQSHSQHKLSMLNNMF